MLALIAEGTGTWWSSRIKAAKRLADLKDPRGLQILAEMTAATQPYLERVGAGEALAQSGIGRGLEILIECAMNRAVRPESRIEAAQKLGGLGERRGNDILQEIASDSSAGKPYVRSPGLSPDPAAHPRIAAAKALIVLGDSRAADILASLASDDNLAADLREAARTMLCRLAH
jgi:HEAT repeat protein